MGNLRSFVSVALVSLAACGDDGGSQPIDALVIIDAAPDAFVPDAPPDAPNYDLSCYQNAAPTTANATVTIAGVAQEAVLQGTMPGIQNAAGVSVQACKGTGACTGQNNLGTTGPTPATGAYSTGALTTGGTPLTGYLIATKTGNRTTYLYPASPLTSDATDAPIFMFSETIVPFLGVAGINQTAGNGMLAVLVTDCSTPPMGIAGAVVSVTQNGAAVGDAPVSGEDLDPQGAGLFFVADVPPGDATVTATYNGMTFRAHDVGSFADALTTTQVKPGY